MIRQDWLDNLGLKPPKTLDELYNVIMQSLVDLVPTYSIDHLPD